MHVHVVGGADDVIDAGMHRDVGCARDQHEIEGTRCRIEERIVGCQWNKDRAVATLGEKVEAVVEELPEHRHPRIERRRQPFVGGDVGDVHVAEDVEGAVRRRYCGRIVRGLIDDQVRDQAGLRVEL